MSDHVRRGIQATLFAVAVSASCVGQAQETGPSPKAGPVSIITLGTHKDVVDSLLGTPRSGWTINVLGRSMFTYRDGTTIVFVDRKAISADLNGLALGNPDQGLIIEREGRKIFFEPIVLRGIPLEGPPGELKYHVEASFHFAQPGYIPPLAEPLPWINPPRHRLLWGRQSQCFPPGIER